MCGKSAVVVVTLLLVCSIEMFGLKTCNSSKVVLESFRGISRDKCTHVPVKLDRRQEDTRVYMKYPFITFSEALSKYKNIYSSGLAFPKSF